jgi:hypothetical protein
MKKQLLTAILAFAPFFIVAHSSFAKASKDTASNKEFVTYLNNIQVAIQKDLNQLSHDEKILEQKFSDYTVSKKILNELFDLPQFQQQTQLLKTEKLMFGLICYKIRSLEGITFIPKNPWAIPTNDFFTFFLWNASKEDEQFCFDLAAELDIDFNRNPNSDASVEENEKELIDHLMKTCVEKYCHKNDTRTLQEKMESMLGSYESVELNTILVYTKILTALLQDIENKIQELQAA